MRDARYRADAMGMRIRRDSQRFLRRGTAASRQSLSNPHLSYRERAGFGGPPRRQKTCGSMTSS